MSSGQAFYIPTHFLQHNPAVFLSSHGQFFSLKERSSWMNQKPNPFVDPQVYKSYLARSEESFNEQLEQQKSIQGRYIMYIEFSIWSFA
jgi:hypothetical protein